MNFEIGEAHLPSVETVASGPATIGGLASMRKRCQEIAGPALLAK